ncbi:MAG: hypothetical protein CMJ78_21785 [Planctomycetaceae bacterium]|nr:hypothetical protein [Planctomycetaceae bacterium]
MGQNPFAPNDSRLTSYVFGELSETEQLEIEQLLESSAEARAALAEIEETVRTLEDGFASQESVALNADQRENVEAACLSDSPAVVTADVTARPKRRWLAFEVSAVVVVLALGVGVCAKFQWDHPEAAAFRYDTGMVRFEAVTGDEAYEEFHSSSQVPHSDGDDGGGIYQQSNELQEIAKGNVSGEALVSEVSQVDSSKEADIQVPVTSGKLVEGTDLGEKSGAKYFVAGKEISETEATRRRTGVQLGSGKNVSKFTGDATAPAANESAPQAASGPRNVTTGPVPAPKPVSESKSRNSNKVAGVEEPGRPRRPLRSKVKADANTPLVTSIKPLQDGLVRGLGQPTGTTPDKSVDLEKIAATDVLKTVPENFRKQVSRYYESLGKKKARPEAEGKPVGNFGRSDGASYFTRSTEGESYNPIHENEFLSPKLKPLSTFGVDVDTASYSNVRRFLDHHQWPNPNAVRIEEMINYFRYEYPQPTNETPFSVNIETGSCPWQPDHRLVRIGLKGKEIDREQRPPSNLVFLLDVSGSMRDANKLPLVKQSMLLLTNEMTEDDRVAIVTYAGDAGVKLNSTMGSDKDKIRAAINALRASGSTNGEAGLRLAYEQAVGNFIKDGTNRIILCSDGDFNVGISSDNELVQMIEGKAKTSVFLSIFGFGMGNIKDSKLEQLADKGNGHYGYVDNIREARKVFTEEMTGTLYTIAKDVKLQVEFNPGQVGAYRLIGYENRKMAAQDFNDDTKDAGDIGAGHSVTALYEIIPVGKLPKAPTVDPLKYQPKKNKPKEVTAEDTNPSEETTKPEFSDELLTVKLRYKQPEGAKSERTKDFSVVDKPKKQAQSSRDFQWAAAVTSFGMLLRNSKYKGDANFDQVLEMANASRGPDKSGHRREFIHIVYNARAMWRKARGLPTESPKELAAQEAQMRAETGGKYAQLLKTVSSPSDWQTYGQFNDYGFWGGKTYAGQSNLPEGYWVYVYPNWYIFKDQKEQENKK